MIVFRRTYRNSLVHSPSKFVLIVGIRAELNLRAENLTITQFKYRAFYTLAFVHRLSNKSYALVESVPVVVAAVEPAPVELAAGSAETGSASPPLA